MQIFVFITVMTLAVVMGDEAVRARSGVQGVNGHHHYGTRPGKPQLNSGNNHYGGNYGSNNHGGNNHGGNTNNQGGGYGSNQGSHHGGSNYGGSKK